MTNKDRIEGKVRNKGKLTGDDSEELKGKTQNKYGKAKDKVEDFADDVSRKVNDFFDKKTTTNLDIKLKASLQHVLVRDAFYIPLICLFFSFVPPIHQRFRIDKQQTDE